MQKTFVLLIALIPLTYILALAWLMGSSWGDELRERAVAPLEFKLRSKLGRDPEVSSRLKVIVFGDKAKKEFGVQELITLQLWQQFIEAIASRAPRAIIFDKFFSFTNGTDIESENFTTSIVRLQIPVIAASAFGPVAGAEGQYDPSQFATWQIDDPSRLERGQIQNMIGPDVRLRHAFTKIGSILLPTTSAVHPAWLETSTQAIVPHLGFSLGSNVKMQANRLEIDNSILYLDRFNRIPVNFIPRNAAYQYFLPAAPILRLGHSAAPLQNIQRGDTVLILPSMYVGSTDFKNSPIGRIEGGLYHMSLLNSVLSNTPLRPVLQGLTDNVIVLILLGFISSFFAQKLKIVAGISVLILSTLAIVLCGLGGFVYFSQISDWHLYSFFFLINGGTVLAVRAAKDERQSQRIESALEGMVAPSVLATIKRKPEVLYRRPNEQRVTVLFVDIEGFSLRTKDLLSVDVFTILHAQIDTISQIIHAHGGVVDRSLGDGLMAFFGFAFEDNQTFQDHAERALRCAIEIQRTAAQLTASTADPKSTMGSIIPLRIGISTGDAFLGNLGSGKRIDFTVIGHTVNTAKRFEDACETFRVFFCPETYKHLQEKNLLNQFADVALRPRLMSVKHYTKLFVGWECDPFCDQQDLFLKAQSKAKLENSTTESASLKQLARAIRTRINESDEGSLIEIGHGHLTMVTQNYYCRKVSLSVELLPDSTQAQQTLASESLKIVYLQVISGSPSPQGGFIHSLSLLHLSPARIQTLVQILTGEKN